MHQSACIYLFVTYTTIFQVDLRTPLHLACLKADLEMVQLLLDGEEADPNPQDSHGFTPLHYRQTLENSEITKCLINRGAAVDIPSKVQLLPQSYRKYYACENDTS